MHLSLRVAVVAAALIPSLTLHALADQRYGVAGEDTYRIGRVLNETHITYHGIEHLGIATDSQGKRYVADVAYTRVDDTGKASVHGKFEQELLHDGSFEDRRDEDPDFLTILNQPFAVQLDLTTLRDLERMQGTVPFAAASPLGGSRLVGSLRAAPPGKIDGRMVVGVRFKADGPMTGTLPPCELTKTIFRNPVRCNRVLRGAGSPLARARCNAHDRRAAAERQGLGAGKDYLSPAHQSIRRFPLIALRGDV